MITLLSLIAFIGGFLYYVKASLLHTKPNRASWLAWVVSSTTMLVSTISIGASLNFLLICIANVAVCVIIFLISLKRGLWGELPPLHKVCTAISCVALICATIPSIPPHVNIILCLIASVDFYPTLCTSLNGKGNEPPIAWGLWSIGIGLGLYSNVLEFTSFWQLLIPIVSFSGHFLIYLFSQYRKQYPILSTLKYAN